MDLTNYIDSKLYIVVPVLYVVGVLFKKSHAVDDRWIPIILGILGIALACVYKFTVHAPESTSEVLALIYSSFTQGILCAAGSVYANNIFKQMTKGDDDEGNSTDDSKDS